MKAHSNRRGRGKGLGEGEVGGEVGDDHLDHLANFTHLTT